MTGFTPLFIPGPTNVPERIRAALNIVMEDQRAPGIPEFTLPLFQDLKKIFKMESGRVFVFPSSGTGGWEAAICNTLSPGDRVLAARFGQFSHLWIGLCQRLGMDVEIVDAPWGEGAPVEIYAERLAADKQNKIKAVLVCQNETATGVTSDVAAVRRAMNAMGHPALLMVDGVSSIASIDFRMEEWGVDVAVSGSQKGFMMPAGLAILAVSQKALDARMTAGAPRCYFDFADMIENNDRGFFPYTPAMHMLRALRVSVDMLLEEGLENVFARHFRLAEGVRRAVDAWGLRLCAADPRWQSDTVSAVMTPDGVDGNEVVRVAYERHGLSLGLGLSRVAGKLFRIGHLGDLNELMLLTGIAGSEMAMRDCAIDIEPGSGVAAAMEFYRNARPRARVAVAAA